MSQSSGQQVQRRRGQALEDAILVAALEELADHGYGGTTIEGIAERARTGKSSLYRRWSTKQELVLDALANALPAVDNDMPDTGSLRADLLQLLTRTAAALNQPAGKVMRTLITEWRHPEIVTAVDQHLVQPRIQRIVDALSRASERGEISLAQPVLLISQIGPAMLVHHQLLRGKQLSETEIAEIIDYVIFPALGLPPGE